MSIKKDLEEAKELWIGSSIVTKMFICVSLFLTTSSLASLSDVVFKWKGFIAQGIKFYQDWISIPISIFASKLGLRYDANEVDLVVLFSIAFSAPVLRTYILKWSSLDKELRIDFFFALGALLFMVLFFGLVVERLSETSLAVGIATFVPFYVWMMKPENKEIKLWGSFHRWRVNFIGPITFSIFTILILGAINAGVSRAT